MALTWITFFDGSECVNPLTIGVGIACCFFFAYLFERFYR
jgi:hypothetical protein